MSERTGTVMDHGMGTGRHSFLLSASILAVLLLTGCGPTPEPAPTPTAGSPTATETPGAPPALVPTPTLACLNDLSFVADITIPDNSAVLPGSGIDKQWLVTNSGSCNWDERYRLRLISGVDLGENHELALYPARAGTQAVLQILFTAPGEPGVYVSEWQAYDPDQDPFGDPFFVKIVVQP